MIKLILIFLAYFIIFSVNPVWAQEKNPPPPFDDPGFSNSKEENVEPPPKTTDREKFVRELASIRNPFVNQLPLPPVVVPPMKPPMDETQNIETPAQPFTPPGPTPNPDSAKPAVEIRPPDIEIQGLVWDSQRPQAIIGNEVYGIGDLVRDMKILSIKKNGLQVLFQDKEFFVEYKTSVRTQEGPPRPSSRRR